MAPGARGPHAPLSYAPGNLKGDKIMYYRDVADIEKVVNSGALAMVKVKNNTYIKQVVEDLQQWQGMNVYKREDIQEKYQYQVCIQCRNCVG